MESESETETKVEVKKGATYRAAMAVMGWAILMKDWDTGQETCIETGIKSGLQAQKRVEYWTKMEAKAVKKAAGKKANG